MLSFLTLSLIVTLRPHPYIACQPSKANTVRSRGEAREQNHSEELRDYSVHFISCRLVLNLIIIIKSPNPLTTRESTKITLRAPNKFLIRINFGSFDNKN